MTEWGHLVVGTWQQDEQRWDVFGLLDLKGVLRPGNNAIRWGLSSFLSVYAYGYCSDRMSVLILRKTVLGLPGKLGI